MLGCLAAPILGDPSHSAADGQHPHSDLKREAPLRLSAFQVGVRVSSSARLGLPA